MLKEVLTLYFTKTNYFCSMIQTTFFKVKSEKTLIGVKYTEQDLSSSRASSFSRTIYLPGKAPEENQTFQKIDLDQFLDICNYYNLLTKEEDSPEPQGSTC